MNSHTNWAFRFIKRHQCRHFSFRLRKHSHSTHLYGLFNAIELEQWILIFPNDSSVNVVYCSSVFLLFFATKAKGKFKPKRSSGAQRRTISSKIKEISSIYPFFSLSSFLFNEVQWRKLFQTVPKKYFWAKKVKLSLGCRSMSGSCIDWSFIVRQMRSLPFFFSIFFWTGPNSNVIMIHFRHFYERSTRSTKYEPFN